MKLHRDKTSLTKFVKLVEEKRCQDARILCAFKMYIMKNNQLSFFDTTTIGRRRLSNRFVVAPMTRVSATSEGIPTGQMGDYYESFARGKFAAIITEGVYTDDIASGCSRNQPGIVTDNQVAGWKQISRRIKKHDALFICQLMHAGSLSQIENVVTIAPSAVKPLGYQSVSSGGFGEFAIPLEMSKYDIVLAIQGYVNAARNAVLAGFDGVEIHAANGYLPDQFITTYSNIREDEYGGSVENRFRFVTEIIAAVRKAVPADFIVGLRMSEGKVNNLAYRWEGGTETARALFSEVKKTAPDYLHIAAEGGGWRRECLYEDGCSSTGIAKQILDCPVIGNGGMHDLDLAQQLLSEKHLDLMAIGRYAISNPDFPVKVLRNENLVPFRKEMIEPMITLSNTRHYFKNPEAGR